MIVASTAMGGKNASTRRGGCQQARVAFITQSGPLTRPATT
jgi:hypothetical protein